MGNIKIEKMVLGMVQTNTWFVINEKTKELILIDPADDAGRIIRKIEADGLKLQGILLTHGHFDHIGAVDELVRQFHCEVYVHPADQVLLEDETLNGMAGMTAHVRTQTTPLMEGTMKLGQIELQILEAPGHTPGSVLIVIGQDCFCGDVVFEGSVGRTDLPLGNDSQMRQTLKMIRMLNPQLNLYPGHGAATTLEKELNDNPFLRTRR